MEPLRQRFGQSPLSFISKEILYQPNQKLKESTDTDLIVAIDGLGSGEGQNRDDSRLHHTQIVQALFYYAAGEMDRAHNAVLPLSWPSATPFGGKAIKCGAAAAQDATYVHAMLHRQEGEFIGQEGGGMLGWDNASYWFSQVGRHAIYPMVMEGARALAKGNKALEGHCRQHSDEWQPSLFLQLCRETHGSGGAVAAFCTGVINLEWGLLLDHVGAKSCLLHRE